MDSPPLHRRQPLVWIRSAHAGTDEHTSSISVSFPMGCRRTAAPPSSGLPSCALLGGVFSSLPITCAIG